MKPTDTGPKKSYNNMGPEVSVNVSKLESDEGLKQQLLSVGKKLCPQDQEVIGAATIFFTKQKSAVIQFSSAGMIMQMYLDDVAEQFAMTAAGEFVRAMQRQYGKELNSVDPNYKIEEDVVKTKSGLIL